MITILKKGTRTTRILECYYNDCQAVLEFDDTEVKATKEKSNGKLVKVYRWVKCPVCKRKIIVA